MVISNDPFQISAKVREAHYNLAHAHVKREVVYVTNAISDCIEGAWTSRDFRWGSESRWAVRSTSPSKLTSINCECQRNRRGKSFFKVS